MNFDIIKLTTNRTICFSELTTNLINFTLKKPLQVFRYPIRCCFGSAEKFAKAFSMGLTGMSKQIELQLQAQMVKFFKFGYTAAEIGRQMQFQTTSVTRVLKRHGCEMRANKGATHGSWKGGRGIKSGYWTVYQPNHPRVLNNGRVWEHVLVLEQHLGRHILKGEPIHHIDLDRQNNAIKNLYLCKNHSDHQRAHKSLDKVVSQLIKDGVIKFNGYEYEYVWETQ